MHKYSHSSYNIPQYPIQQNEERFIWPIVPFIGGALVGYIAGRPQANYTYPSYYPYPVYYPYSPYYQQQYYTYQH